MTRTPGQVGRAEAALTEAGAADAGSAVVTTVAADIPASNTAAAGTATRERMAYLLAPSQEWIGFRRHVNRVFQRKTRKSAENATTRKLPAITAILHRRESGLTASSRGCPGGPPRGAREPARRRKRGLRLARAGPPMAVTPSVPGRTIRGLAGTPAPSPTGPRWPPTAGRGDPPGDKGGAGKPAIYAGARGRGLSPCGGTERIGGLRHRRTGGLRNGRQRNRRR